MENGSQFVGNNCKFVNVDLLTLREFYYQLLQMAVVLQEILDLIIINICNKCVY
jgi:hypothetical protein